MTTQLTIFPAGRVQILERLNDGLEGIKMEFHKTGRFDDANAKLDEVLKLLTIKFFELKTKKKLITKTGLSLSQSLQDSFAQVAAKDIFLNDDGSNVFGSNPHLNIRESDEGLIIKLLQLIESLELDRAAQLDFDILNEAFGHFIRVNFRNHKEDGQYMTPIEVVDLMIEMAIDDIVSSNEILKKDSFTVMDPTCGVGTFLVTFAKQIKHQKILLDAAIEYVGQDKVDRMVRMAKINALFSDISPKNIRQGNSILSDSFIDSYKGKVDLILTNPPFGADFYCSEVLDQEKYPMLTELANSTSRLPPTLPSELLMIDRGLTLLKEGGSMLVVVPDSVVSAEGVFESLRKRIEGEYTVKAVIDLPSVTFAQAGTRTRCSILNIQKKKCSDRFNVFFAKANDIGFQVKERMGSPMKISEGTNELLDIATAYQVSRKVQEDKVISQTPSAVILSAKKIVNGKWNANFYNSSRVNAIGSLDALDKKFDIVRLDEVIELISKKGRRANVDENTKQISVLHVNKDMTIALDEIETYVPKGAGITCSCGDILFSKINPRIPRITIVPHFGKQLTCSPEFEILKPKKGLNPYLLRMILLSPVVQDQINALTSGTSSSHNRIKFSELRGIQIALPKRGTEIESKLEKMAQQTEKYEKLKYEANSVIEQCSTELNELLTH